MTGQIPEGFARDDDPFTVEDGRGEDQDRPLPDLDPDDYPDQR